MAVNKTNLLPRKIPVQHRSTTTVSAIFEGCIQVLLIHGLERLTTTKVAERAGVSVGTLYQYFPNKESLIVAVLESHLMAVIEAIEATCERTKGKALDVIAHALVVAFVRAKMYKPMVSKALYAVAADVGGAAIVNRLTQRAQISLCSVLATAKDAHFDDLSTVSYLLATSLIGPVQGLLMMDATPEVVDAIERQLTILITAYLQRLQEPPKLS